MSRPHVRAMGVSIVRILEKIANVIAAPHCILCPGQEMAKASLLISPLG